MTKKGGETGSVYISACPPEVRAKFLLKYEKRFGEVWAYVPGGSSRFRRLSALVESCSVPGVNPVSLMEYFDCIGATDALLDSAAAVSGHQICCVSGGMNGAFGKGWTGYMEVLTEVTRKMEKEFGHVWMFDMHNHSDIHYVYFGFEDKAVDVHGMWSSPDLAGNDCKFLCRCGQYRGRKAFLEDCPWVVDRTTGHIMRGIAFNDSTNRGGCSDWVFRGGRSAPFMNRGYVGNTLADESNGSGYSYLAVARNIDGRKCRFFECEFGSIEEFVVHREVGGGLRPGDYFYRKPFGDYPLWDGEKWVDQRTERPIKAV